jgi:hypothetical protein
LVSAPPVCRAVAWLAELRAPKEDVRVRVEAAASFFPPRLLLSELAAVLLLVPGRRACLVSNLGGSCASLPARMHTPRHARLRHARRFSLGVLLHPCGAIFWSTWCCSLQLLRLFAVAAPIPGNYIYCGVA